MKIHSFVFRGMVEITIFDDSHSNKQYLNKVPHGRDVMVAYGGIRMIPCQK